MESAHNYLKMKDGIFDFDTCEFKLLKDSSNNKNEIRGKFFCDYVCDCDWSIQDVEGVDDSEIEELMLILGKIFPDSNQLKQILDNYASCLNKPQFMININYGVGANGKSFVNNLMRKALGDYVLMVNSNTLQDIIAIRRIESNSIKYIYHCNDIMDESISLDFIMNIYIKFRKYQIPIFIDSMINPKNILAKLDLIKSKHITKAAIMKRIRINNFKSIFEENPNDVDTENNIYLRNDMYDQIDRLGLVFLKILLQRFYLGG